MCPVVAEGCSLSDAGRVGELGEVCPLVQFQRAQAVICGVGWRCRGDEGTAGIPTPTPLGKYPRERR